MLNPGPICFSITFTNEPAYKTSTGPDPFAVVALGVDVVAGVDPVVVDADLLELEHAAPRTDKPANVTTKKGTRRPDGRGGR